MKIFSYIVPNMQTSKESKPFTNRSLYAAVNEWCRHRSLVEAEYGHISTWNTTQVTCMAYLFEEQIHFNDDISMWDVAKVTEMSSMFFNAKSFNQPIGLWNTSGVTNMSKMFYHAHAFNNPIGQWDVSRVTSMPSMFADAQQFNQPIGQWDVSHVHDMHRMFLNASRFNQHLGQWDVSGLYLGYVEDIEINSDVEEGEVTLAFYPPAIRMEYTGVFDASIAHTNTHTQSVWGWNLKGDIRHRDYFYYSNNEFRNHTLCNAI